MVSDLRETLGAELRRPGFKKDSRKMGYACITGLLPSDDDPPPMSTKAYERNPFNKFFCLFTEATYLPEDYYQHPKTNLSEEVIKLITMLKKQVTGLDDSHLNDHASLIRFLKGSEDDSTHGNLNNLSLSIFGGHIEQLVLLCTAKHAAKHDYLKINRFLVDRFSNEPEQPPAHPEPQKSALFSAYSRLSVAPVYIRGSYRYLDETYHILQLSTKPYDSTKGEGVNPVSLRRLHTTFCIKQEEDHPSRGTEASMIGQHRQIRIQGGMMQLMKKQNAREDLFPILLDNTRILSDDDMVDW
jgi:hypothetical protein